MFSFTAINVLLACLLAAIVQATSTFSHRALRRDSTLCGQGQHPGILKPTANETLVVSWEDQLNLEYVLEIVYCSDAYFKTSSLNVTAWLGFNGGSGGELLASGISPDYSVADGGFYGYRFNVTLTPIDDGSWDSNELRTLNILEWQTGYYYEYGVELSSVELHLSLAPEPVTTTSSASTHTSSTNTSTTAALATASSKQRNMTSLSTHMPTHSSSTGTVTIATSDACHGSAPTYGLPPPYPTYGA